MDSLFLGPVITIVRLSLMENELTFAHFLCLHPDLLKYADVLLDPPT